MTENIRVFTQSSIRIEAEDKIFYVDPFQIPEAFQDADFIFLTHDHYDHFSPEDLTKVMKERSIIVAPENLAEQVLPLLPAHGRLVAVKPNTACETAGVFFETVPAYNLQKDFHPKSAGWVGYILKAGGLRIYVAGDTDATPEAQQVHCDIAMVPIGGTYTMDAKEAAALVNDIHPLVAIPIHYGSIVGKPEDAEVFKKAVHAPIHVELKL